MTAPLHARSRAAYCEILAKLPTNPQLALTPYELAEMVHYSKRSVLRYLKHGVDSGEIIATYLPGAQGVGRGYMTYHRPAR